VNNSFSVLSIEEGIIYLYLWNIACLAGKRKNPKETKRDSSDEELSLVTWRPAEGTSIS
jgi:hypothetical protein